ncbi:MAG TPA: hypothetical protein VMG60_24100 [Burkholderiaceae bacterium]|nr:hypothetical protein [Burkholderiaceae bacterium]
MEMISARLLEPQQSPEQDGLDTVSREEVAFHFSTRAPGVDAKTAAARTKGFYRSSGNAWARVLS